MNCSFFHQALEGTRGYATISFHWLKITSSSLQTNNTGFILGIYDKKLTNSKINVRDV